MGRRAGPAGSGGCLAVNRNNQQDPNRVRVAVIGASGIGKHHANWWRLEGADLCAFLGSSEASTARTRRVLKETFGIDIPGYCDVHKMLEIEQPAIADVCTPPALHYEHVRAALDAGCHVLCEKPFVYDPALPREELLAQADALIALARQRGRRLGLCTQYAAGAPIFLELWRRAHGVEPITRYYGHLESPARGRAPDPRRVWVDLAPHPLSVLRTLVVNARVDWNSAQTTFNGYEASARFQAIDSQGNEVSCEIITRNATDPPSNLRRFAINDYTFRVEGGKDPSGAYCARIMTPEGEHEKPDFMRVLIREFLAGRCVADGPEGRENLDLLTHFLTVADG